MTLRSKTKGRVQIVASMLLACCLLPAAVSAVASGATWRPDPWVTTKIKILLMTDEDVSAFDVNVDTVDGRVSLHGKVRTEREKSRAEAIARNVAGVTGVQNLLQVVPADELDRTAVRDEALRKSVSDVLRSDPKLEGSAIRVKSVNQGVVLLSGKADSLMQHLEAIRVASTVEGVQRVATEVEAGEEPYDQKLWRDAEGGIVKRVEPGSQDWAAEKTARPVEAQGESHEIIEDAADGGNPGLTEPGPLSDAMTDASITASIRMKLLEDAQVPALSINIDTRDGVVTLFGKAHNEEARKTAEAYAQTVPGVVEVANEILVVHEDDSVATVEDERLERQVRNAIDTREPLARSEIKISVVDGVVQLRGSTSSSDLKVSAATIARAVPGVRSVRNELQVRR